MPGPDFKIAVPKTLVRRVFRTIDAKKRKIATERRADLENAVRRELEFHQGRRGDAGAPRRPRRRHGGTR
jgi:hypothetical protein